MSDTAGATLVDWATYEDPRAGFSIEYPSTWRVRRGHGGLLVSVTAPATHDGFASNVNLVRRANDVRLDLDELARSAIREVRRLLTDVLVVDLDTAVVDESPARRIVFAYRQGVYGLTTEQWIWIDSDHIWTLTAGSLTDEYDAVADAFPAIAERLRVHKDV